MNLIFPKRSQRSPSIPIRALGVVASLVRHQFLAENVVTHHAQQIPLQIQTKNNDLFVKRLPCQGQSNKIQCSLGKPLAQLRKIMLEGWQIKTKREHQTRIN